MFLYWATWDGTCPFESIYQWRTQVHTETQMLLASYNYNVLCLMPCGITMHEWSSQGLLRSLTLCELVAWSYSASRWVECLYDDFIHRLLYAHSVRLALALVSLSFLVSPDERYLQCCISYFNLFSFFALCRLSWRNISLCTWSSSFHEAPLPNADTTLEWFCSTCDKPSRSNSCPSALRVCGKVTS